MFLADTAGAMLRGVAPHKRLRMYPYCTLKTEQRKHECKSKATEGTFLMKREQKSNYLQMWNFNFKLG